MMYPQNKAGTLLVALLVATAAGGRSGAVPHRAQDIIDAMPVVEMQLRLCEAEPLGLRAPVAPPPLARGCEACKAPLLPLAVSSIKGTRHEMHQATLGLVRAFVSDSGSREARDGRFAQDMMQQRLNRFFPRQIDLRKLRQEEEETRQSHAKAPSLRHLLSVRSAMHDRYGPDVGVHPYFGDPTVRFSLTWRLAPDEHRTCNVSGDNVTVTRLAFQPVHDTIDRPLWQLRLENSEDADWNPNVLSLESPLQDKSIPDPMHAVDLTFKNFMEDLALILHLGWTEEQGDYILLAHMKLGHFGVRRTRSEYEEYMDGRAFSHLLHRVVQAAVAGNATVEDGMMVLDRLLEAGLEPSYSDLANLMAVAIAAAQCGSDDPFGEVEKVLDLMQHMYVPAEDWVYMAGFEALAWGAFHGKAGLDEAEELLCRMTEPETALPARTMPTAYPGPLQDPDFYACFLAVVAGAAHSRCKNEERMNVVFEKDDDGMVGARALEEGEKPLTWLAHGEHMVDRMRQDRVQPNILVYHAWLQLAVGGAKAGEVGMEELETLLASLLDSRIALHHQHAHSLLAAAVVALELDKVSLEQVEVIIDYIRMASLEMDALCYSLWLRALAHSVRNGDASIADLLDVIEQAHAQDMRFCTKVVALLSEAVADNVRLELGRKIDLQQVPALRKYTYIYI